MPCLEQDLEKECNACLDCIVERLLATPTKLEQFWKSVQTSDNTCKRQYIVNGWPEQTGCTGAAATAGRKLQQIFSNGRMGIV